MKKSFSAPCLHTLSAPRRLSISCNALPVPNSPLEEIGFHSILHVSHSTFAECSTSARTADFPKMLLNPSTDEALDLASCIATPTESPELPEPVYRSGSNNLNTERFARLLLLTRKRNGKK